MTPTTATIVTEGFHLIKELSYVALFAYITHEGFDYARGRLTIYGQVGDLFPPAPTAETDEPEWYRKGNTIGPLGFRAPETAPDAAPSIPPDTMTQGEYR